MTNRFSPARITRLILFCSILIILTYYITTVVTNPKKNDAQIPPLTKMCIDSRKTIVDQNITDLNCSYEDGINRLFYSVSDDYQKIIVNKYPFKGASISCQPFKLHTVIKRDPKISEQELSDYFEHHSRELCALAVNLNQENTEFNYVDQGNVPVMTLTYIPQNK